MSLKKSVTPPGIDPGTVRLVAQSLKHYTTPGPKYVTYKYKILSIYTVIIERSAVRTISKVGWVQLPKKFFKFFVPEVSYHIKNAGSFVCGKAARITSKYNERHSNSRMFA
jgi:hypothetical protein